MTWERNSGVMRGYIMDDPMTEPKLMTKAEIAAELVQPDIQPAGTAFLDGGVVYQDGRVSERARSSFLQASQRLLDAESHRIDKYAVRGNIGIRIRKRRMELEMSQGMLGQLLGVSRETVSQYEIGRGRIDASEMPKLAVILGVSETYFTKNTLFSTETPPADLLEGLDESDRRVVADVIDSLRKHRKGGEPDQN